MTTISSDHTSSVRADQRRFGVGDTVILERLRTIHGDPVLVPDPPHLVHLQFRRFAGCPVCDLHLQSMARRRADIAAAGIRQVVLFHSTVEEMRRHVADLPFATVADPDRRLYRQFGVEAAPRALLDPRAWAPILRSVASSFRATLRDRKPVPPLNPRGGRLGLPADFLIGRDGRVIACKFGSHLYDQWSVDELLNLAVSGG